MEQKVCKHDYGKDYFDDLECYEDNFLISVKRKITDKMLKEKWKLLKKMKKNFIYY